MHSRLVDLHHPKKVPHPKVAEDVLEQFLGLEDVLVTALANLRGGLLIEERRVGDGFEELT